MGSPYLLEYEGKAMLPASEFSCQSLAWQIPLHYRFTLVTTCAHSFNDAIHMDLT